MELIYISKDKVFACFFCGFISQILAQNYHKSVDNTLNIISFLKQIIHFIQSSINNNDLIFIKNFNNYDDLLELFPLILYSYHHQNILEIIKKFNNSQHLLLLNKVITAILARKIDSEYSIEPIIKRLNNDNLQTDNYLQLLTETITKKISFIEVNQLFSEKIEEQYREIYQALYIFFSNPYDIEKSLQRSLYFSTKSEETTVLTGHLLGLYHGYFNLPYHWTISPEFQAKKQEIAILVDRLVALWQGKMDNRERELNEPKL